MAFRFPIITSTLLIFLLLHCLPAAISHEEDDSEIPSHLLPFEPKPNSPKAVIQISKISEVLWDSGFRIMSLLLERNLPLDLLSDHNNTITIYSNNTITLFAPRDEAIDFDRWRQWFSLKYQIVAGKVDKEDFVSGSLKRGSELFTFDVKWSELYISGLDSINDEKITHWNIYNDGHVIVHGVEDFFNCKRYFEFKTGIYVPF